MSISAIILAAGFSRRLGQPKQILRFDGEMLVERAVRIAREAGLSPVFVITRPEPELVSALEPLPCVAVLNDQAQEGMASSIRLGIAASESVHAEGAVLLTCDQPAVTPDLLRKLSEDAECIRGSFYADRIGIPAYFPATSFNRLLELSGDIGARQLLRGAQSISWPGLELDIDTADDLARAQMLFGQRN